MVVLSRINGLELRLASSSLEIDAAQALRYRIFYGEMGAVASPAVHLCQRDVDEYDAHADHLIVVDLDRSTRRLPVVVGCYRLLRASVAEGRCGFYTSNEFDLDDVVSPSGETMELGRSCIDAAYRGGTVMQFLWKGISDYLDQHRIGLMLGCASLPGTDPDAVALPLAYLHHHHLAPRGMRPRALPHRHVAADRLPVEAIDTTAAIKALPPLLKGYLRVGGMIGEGAVVDHAFNTVDVCLVLPTARIQARYQRHFAQLRAPVPLAA